MISPASDPIYQATLSEPETVKLTLIDRFIGGLARCNFFPKKSKQELHQARERLYRTFPTAKRVRFYSPEGFKLDAIHVTPQAKSEKEVPRAVLFCPGADGYYEDNWSYAFIDWVQKQIGNVHVLIINYAGVQESKGNFHPKTLASSVYSSFCYLVEKSQIDPRHIAIFSQSMGGFATNLALPLIQRRYPQSQFCLINERSMGSFMPIIAHLARTQALGRLQQAILRKGGWDVKDLGQAFAQMPGRKLIIHCPDDPVIPLEAFMLTNLRQQAQKFEVQVLTLREAQKSENGHMRAFHKDELDEIATHIRYMIELDLEAPSHLPLTRSLESPVF